MDWQVIGSVASAIAAIAAMITAVIMVFQVRLMRHSIGVDVLLRLDAHFNSADMRSIRRKAAEFLLWQRFGRSLLGCTQHEGKTALDDLLDFFEGIAYLARKRRTPDAEDVWCFFFHFVEHYWQAAKDYIKQSREQEKDELRWQELEHFRNDLVAIERKHCKYRVPDDDQLRRFLEDEMQLTV